LLSVWDRLFGTYTPPEPAQQVAYGLDGTDTPAQQTTLALLVDPFRRRAPANPIATHVRPSTG
jgi:sterol desaturase/sphingolipid hydroxylase (fatty acid hydroxylase superfamily)